jgi:DNA-binding IclR family transcriptional regulator
MSALTTADQILVALDAGRDALSTVSVLMQRTGLTRAQVDAALTELARAGRVERGIGERDGLIVVGWALKRRQSRTAADD